MEINNVMDKLVQQRQAKCDHNYQDKIVTDSKTFCGKCGVEEK